MRKDALDQKQDLRPRMAEHEVLVTSILKLVGTNLFKLNRVFYGDVVNKQYSRSWDHTLNSFGCKFVSPLLHMR